MAWIIVMLFFMVLLFVVVAILYIRERRYLKSKTSEVMNRELFEEVIAEEKEALDKKRKFQEAIEKARTNS